ncbi:unnamed protein product [Calypogeia fissa]
MGVSGWKVVEIKEAKEKGNYWEIRSTARWEGAIGENGREELFRVTYMVGHWGKGSGGEIRDECENLEFGGGSGFGGASGFIVILVRRAGKGRELERRAMVRMDSDGSNWKELGAKRKGGRVR